MVSLAMVVVSIGLYAKGTSAEVQKLIKENNLQIVQYEDVVKAVGDGTRKNAKALILDARPAKKYNAAHIPSAQPLPDTKFERQYDVFYSKVDKSKPIIVYCGGIKCTKSPKVAIELIKKGHKDVKVYINGMPEWKKKSYTEVDAKVAKKIFDAQAALFIDARPYGKFAKSTIIGAINVPDTKFEKFAKFMPVDKKAPIITFCGGFACHKSHAVANKLVALGYTNVKVLASGFPYWKKRKYGITGGGEVAAKKEMKKLGKSKSGLIEQGYDKGTVDGAWFVKNYKALPKSVTLVDVRGPEDFKKGTITGAINIQAEKMKPAEFAKVIPNKGDVIFFCGTGTRAMEAVDFLKEAKSNRLDNAFYLDANIECDKSNNCKIKPNSPLGM
jgi:rhodanese-related sulfurtransferase